MNQVGLMQIQCDVIFTTFVPFILKKEKHLPDSQIFKTW